MMISPESFIEEHLQGQGKELILRAIRGCKQEMGRLKCTMEHPDYHSRPIVNPDEATQLLWSREYLKIIKRAYVEAGGTNTFSREEEKAAAFDANLNAICKITFHLGGFDEGYHDYVVEIPDELNARTRTWENEEPLVLRNVDDKEVFTSDTFLAMLAELHLGEWRGTYTLNRFGGEVCDGEQWRLEIQYMNGRKSVSFRGDNAYPHNFDQLMMLLGINRNEGGCASFL